MADETKKYIQDFLDFAKKYGYDLEEVSEPDRTFLVGAPIDLIVEMATEFNVIAGYRIGLGFSCNISNPVHPVILCERYDRFPENIGRIFGYGSEKFMKDGYFSTGQLAQTE